MVLVLCLLLYCYMYSVMCVCHNPVCYGLFADLILNLDSEARTTTVQLKSKAAINRDWVNN